MACLDRTMDADLVIHRSIVRREIRFVPTLHERIKESNIRPVVREITFLLLDLVERMPGEERNGKSSKLFAIPFAHKKLIESHHGILLRQISGAEFRDRVRSPIFTAKRQMTPFTGERG